MIIMISHDEETISPQMNSLAPRWRWHHWKPVEGETICLCVVILRLSVVTSLTTQTLLWSSITLSRPTLDTPPWGEDTPPGVSSPDVHFSLGSREEILASSPWFPRHYSYWIVNKYKENCWAVSLNQSSAAVHVRGTDLTGKEIPSSLLQSQTFKTTSVYSPFWLKIYQGFKYIAAVLSWTII